MKTRLLSGLLTGLLWSLLPAPPAHAGEGADAHRVQAALLYQFTNYIDWPPAPESDAFVISIVGDSPVFAELEKMAATKKAKGRRIELHRSATTAALEPSHVVYIPEPTEASLGKIGPAAKAGPALIVTGNDRFVGKGAMIGFFVEDERIRFKVSRAAIGKAGLQISSQLLKYAQLVDETDTAETDQSK